MCVCVCVCVCVFVCVCVCVCVCVLFFEGQTRTTGAARWGDDDALSKGRKNNCLLPWEKTFFLEF